VIPVIPVMPSLMGGEGTAADGGDEDAILAGYADDFYDWAVASMPDWYAEEQRSNEYLHGAARIFANSRYVAADWLGKQTRILLASGGEDGGPDFLGQHARDRGTYRQNGESSEDLRARLRSIPKQGITPEGLLGLVNDALATAGIAGSAALVELTAPDGAYLGKGGTPAGTGGSFATLSSPTLSGMVFTPSSPLAAPPPVGAQLTIASSSGNNGTFAVTGVYGNGVVYTNASGVANASDPAAAWTLKRSDSGFSWAYCDRGYRANPVGQMSIIIMPYGTSAELAASILEGVRKSKPAGTRIAVEWRQSP